VTNPLSRFWKTSDINHRAQAGRLAARKFYLQCFDLSLRAWALRRPGSETSSASIRPIQGAVAIDNPKLRAWVSPRCGCEKKLYIRIMFAKLFDALALWWLRSVINDENFRTSVCSHAGDGFAKPAGGIVSRKQNLDILSQQLSAPPLRTGGA